MKTVDREKLWEEYQKKKTPELREKLIIEYSPLVKLVAGRLSMYLGYNVEYDDLVSYGIFGLIDAIDKFDLGKEVKFETYASLRIRGTILDQIRKMDWIPRTVITAGYDLSQWLQSFSGICRNEILDIIVSIICVVFLFPEINGKIHIQEI